MRERRKRRRRCGEKVHLLAGEQQLLTQLHRQVQALLVQVQVQVTQEMDLRELWWHLECEGARREGGGGGQGTGEHTLVVHTEPVVVEVVVEVEMVVVEVVVEMVVEVVVEMVVDVVVEVVVEVGV